MQEQLISFEIAKLAKEKRFEEYCFSYYDLKGNIKHNYLENGSSTDVEFRVDLEDLLDNFNRGIPNTYSAPTQSLLQKWLREVHNIHVFAVTEPLSNYYRVTISNKNKENYTEYSTYYKTYEEALEIGLQDALELIPDGNKDK